MFCSERVREDEVLAASIWIYRLGKREREREREREEKERGIPDNI